MNAFFTALALGNTAFGISNQETFDVVKNGTGGTYTATSIDNLASATSVIPGGTAADNKVLIFLPKTTFDLAKIIIGTVLIARGDRIRVESIDNDGDGSVTLTCDTTAIKF